MGRMKDLFRRTTSAEASAEAEVLRQEVEILRKEREQWLRAREESRLVAEGHADDDDEDDEAERSFRNVTCKTDELLQAKQRAHELEVQVELLQVNTGPKEAILMEYAEAAVRRVAQLETEVRETRAQTRRLFRFSSSKRDKLDRLHLKSTSSSHGSEVSVSGCDSGQESPHSPSASGHKRRGTFNRLNGKLISTLRRLNRKNSEKETEDMNTNGSVMNQKLREAESEAEKLRSQVARLEAESEAEKIRANMAQLEAQQNNKGNIEQEVKRTRALEAQLAFLKNEINANKKAVQESPAPPIPGPKKYVAKNLAAPAPPPPPVLDDGGVTDSTTISSTLVSRSDSGSPQILILTPPQDNSAGSSPPISPRGHTVDFNREAPFPRSQSEILQRQVSTPVPTPRNRSRSTSGTSTPIAASRPPSTFSNSSTGNVHADATATVTATPSHVTGIDISFIRRKDSAVDELDSEIKAPALPAPYSGPSQQAIDTLKHELGPDASRKNGKKWTLRNNWSVIAKKFNEPRPGIDAMDLAELPDSAITA